MHVTPVTPELLAAEVTELVAARPGRVRLAVDGPPPTSPRALADAVAIELRARGRAAVVVDAADYLRPASLRLEFGRTDPDMFLDGWLDVGGLRREVLEPAGTGRVGPRAAPALGRRAPTAPTATPTSTCPRTASSCSPARCCWAAGCRVDLAVHLRMSEKALARRLPDDERVDAAGLRPLRGGEHTGEDRGSAGAGRPSGPPCGAEVS